MTRIAEDDESYDVFQTLLIPRVIGIEDSSRNWSVAMVLEHLCLTNAEMTIAVDSLSRGIVPKGEVDIALYKPDPDVGMAVFDRFRDVNQRYIRDDRVVARCRRQIEPTSNVSASLVWLAKPPSVACPGRHASTDSSSTSAENCGDAGNHLIANGECRIVSSLARSFHADDAFASGALPTGKKVRLAFGKPNRLVIDMLQRFRNAIVLTSKRTMVQSKPSPDKYAVAGRNFSKFVALSSEPLFQRDRAGNTVWLDEQPPIV